MNHLCPHCGLFAELTAAAATERTCPVCCVLSWGSYRTHRGDNTHLQPGPFCAAEGLLTLRELGEEALQKRLLAARAAIADAKFRDDPDRDGVLRALRAYMDAIEERLRESVVWAVGRVTWDARRVGPVRRVPAGGAADAATAWYRYLVDGRFTAETSSLLGRTHDVVVVSTVTLAAFHARLEVRADGTTRAALVGDAFEGDLLCDAFHAVRVAALT